MEKLEQSTFLENMGNCFSRVTGQTVSFSDKSGAWKSAIKIDDFTELCKAVMQNKEGRERCMACNCNFGKVTANEYCVDVCHMGLSMIKVSLGEKRNNGIVLSYGQFLTEDTEKEFYDNLRERCAEINLNHEEIKDKASSLPVLTKSELQARIQLLLLFSRYIKAAEGEIELLESIKRTVLDDRLAIGSSQLAYPYMESGSYYEAASLLPISPKMIMISFIKEDPTSYKRIMGEVNLRAPGGVYTECGNGLLIGYIGGNDEEIEEKAKKLLAIWSSILGKSVFAGSAYIQDSGSGILSYNQAKDLARAAFFKTVSDAPELIINKKEVTEFFPYPQREEAAVLEAVKSGKENVNGIEDAAFKLVDAIVAASGGDPSRLQKYLSIFRSSLLKLYSRYMEYEIDELEIGFISGAEELKTLLLSELKRAAKELSGGRSNINDHVQKTLVAINKRYREDIKLESIAKELYVNSAYLGRIFKKETGQSFREAITEKRMEAAEQLIANGCSIKQAGEQVGYNDSNYFSRIYKKHRNV